MKGEKRYVILHPEKIKIWQKEFRMYEIEKFIDGPNKNLKERSIKVLGIDLGTTNSIVSEIIWNPPEPPTCRVIEIPQPTEAGEYISPLVPSVVVQLGDDKIWVGEGAKRLMAFPEKAGLYVEKNLFFETKNDMGRRKKYYRAPENLNHASKIAGVILSFLMEKATNFHTITYDNVCVTVPASFQINQRRDTLLACKYANINLKDDDLLDEPIAALIDYAMNNNMEDVFSNRKKIKCLVFDFGGGTCDVSVMELGKDYERKKITISELSVSRYHRLGGGDIDSAIVHEILIPELLKENNLSRLDLSWAEKKKGLEPQLLGTAEALKISLSKEIDKLIKFNKYLSSDKSQIIVKQPSIRCKLGKREFILSNPSLTAEEFEKILSPFIDTEFLFLREDEYRITQSIFSPITNALESAGVKANEIDFCLLVGGSSLIPQVKMSVQKFFKNGKVGFYSNYLDMQVAVSRGAAWNSLLKFLNGKPFIQPILHDGIDIVTEGKKRLNLIPPHAELPFPDENSFEKITLYVPSIEKNVQKLRLEIVGSREGQTILNEIWKLPVIANGGDEIILEYRITSGKQFECRAYLLKSPEEYLELTVENPLVNVVNPNLTYLKIEEYEEYLRNKNGGTRYDIEIFIKLANLYGELNQYEKAIDYLKLALKKLNRGDAEILNLMGIFYERLGDHERAEKAYIEASKYSSWDGPIFNLALNYYHRGNMEKAIQLLDNHIKRKDVPSLVLKALCLGGMRRIIEKNEILLEATKKANIENMSTWELEWLKKAAELLRDEKLKEEVEREISKRSDIKKYTQDNVLYPSSEKEPIN